MVYAIEKVLRRYGSSLILRRSDKTVCFHGFLQHSGSKSWQNMERSFGPLGEIPRGQYVLLAPLDPELKEGDTLVQGTLETAICRLETVTVGDKAVYRWGLCTKKGGEDTWAMQL